MNKFDERRYGAFVDEDPRLAGIFVASLEGGNGVSFYEALGRYLVDGGPFAVCQGEIAVPLFGGNGNCWVTVSDLGEVTCAECSNSAQPPSQEGGEWLCRSCRAEAEG